MHKKLTLRIDEALIESAKGYSKAHGKSLSQLVADYLYLITAKNSTTRQVEETPPLTQSLKGILKKRQFGIKR